LVGILYSNEGCGAPAPHRSIPLFFAENGIDFSGRRAAAAALTNADPQRSSTPARRPQRFTPSIDLMGRIAAPAPPEGWTCERQREPIHTTTTRATGR
jgi:hypothetical protein